MHLVKPIVKKYGLTLKKVFEDEEDFSDSAVCDGESTVGPLYEVDYNGSLVLSSTQETSVAPISPSFRAGLGPLFRHDSALFCLQRRRCVPVGELMTGNTDTRHYLGMILLISGSSYPRSR